MTTHQQLEQQIFDLDIRVDKLESPTNKILTKEKIKEFIDDQKYQANFVKTRHGNGIKSGTELIVKVRGAEVVTGKLSKNGKLLIIDQSHKNDEDRNGETINFRLKRKNRFWPNSHLPTGMYELHIWFYNAKSGERGLYRDKFFIFNKESEKW